MATIRTSTRSASDPDSPGEGAAGPGPLRRSLNWWRPRRLSLRNLGSGRAWVLVGLLAGVVSGVGIVALGSDWGPPGGTQIIGNNVGSVSRLAVVVTALGLLGAVAGIGAGTALSGWALRWPSVVAVGRLGAAIAGGTVGAAGVVEGFFPGAHPLVVLVAGWIGMAGAAAFVVTAALRPRRPTLAGAMAAVPFLMWVVGYIGVGGARLVGPPEIAARDVVASSVVAVALDLGIAGGLLLLWAALEAVRQARDMGLGLVRITRGLLGFLMVAVMAKLAWLAVGYADRLPGWLQGPEDGWSESRANGVTGWVLAIVLVTVATVWVARTRRRAPGDEDLERAVGGAVAGFAFPLALATAAFLFVEVAFLWPSTGPAQFFLDVGSFLIGVKVPPWAVVGTIVAMVVAVVVLWRVRRPWAVPTALVVVAVAVWCLPRAGTTAWRLITESEPAYHSPSLITLDTVVTVAVGVLAVLWAARRQRFIEPGGLLMALLVSTLIARPGVLLPPGWKAGVLFFAALVYGPAYRFLLDARTLNRASEDRPARVVRATGLAALLLVAALFRVASGTLGPGIEGQLDTFLGDVGRLFLMVPLGAVLVATYVLSLRERRAATKASGADPADTV